MKIVLFRKWLDRIVKHTYQHGTFYSFFGLTICFPDQIGLVPETWEIKPFKGEISHVLVGEQTWSIWGPVAIKYSDPVFSRTLHLNTTLNGPLTIVVYHCIKTTKRKRQFWKGTQQTMTEVNVLGNSVDERYCYKGTLSNKTIRSNVVTSMKTARELLRILNNET